MQKEKDQSFLRHNSYFILAFAPRSPSSLNGANGMSDMQGSEPDWH
jgi:hypothetical protein